MASQNINTKRMRDEEDKEKIESSQNKKQECVYNDSRDHDKCYEFYDSFGVFDFPWLREGVIFKGEEYLDDFSRCLDGSFAANLDESCGHNLCVSPTLEGNFHDQELDDDTFWSLLVDDLEPIDCIWSCVIDQPLDIGYNKS